MVGPIEAFFTPIAAMIWLNIYELYRSTQTSLIIETFQCVDLQQSKLNSDIVQHVVMNLYNSNDMI